MPLARNLLVQSSWLGLGSGTGLHILEGSGFVQSASVSLGS